MRHDIFILYKKKKRKQRENKKKQYQHVIHIIEITNIHVAVIHVAVINVAVIDNDHFISIFKSIDVSFLIF